MLKFFDIPIFNFINHSLSNPFFNFIMPLITYLGMKELIFALGVLLLFFKKRETKVAGILLMIGIVLSYFATGFLKVLIARPRPFVALPNVILLVHKEGALSFPSGHATTAFMAAVILSNRFKHNVIFYLLALLIAFSRIYIGAHFPTDVIAGALVGTSIGWILVYAYNRLPKTNE